MLRLGASTRVFAATSPAHFQKGIDGLVQVVREECGEDPFSGTLFCFFSQRRNRVKILVWDRNGFWILSKRLERGCFERIHLLEPWVELDRLRLSMLLEGLDTRTAKWRSNFAREVHIYRRGGDDDCERTAE